MGTKMKGVLKGLRYISQIFPTGTGPEDGKAPEMQIGFPTDVKHVGHIGSDGTSPSIDSSPSWMKEYQAPDGAQTANEEGKENSNLRSGSQDSSNRRGSGSHNNATRDLPKLPKSSRLSSLADNSSEHTGSPRESKSRRSSKSTQKQKDAGSGSPSRILPVLPKKSNRKKSKESSTGASTRSRKKADPPSKSHSSPYSDPR